MNIEKIFILTATLLASNNLFPGGGPDGRGRRGSTSSVSVHSATDSEPVSPVRSPNRRELGERAPRRRRLRMRLTTRSLLNESGSERASQLGETFPVVQLGFSVEIIQAFQHPTETFCKKEIGLLIQDMFNIAADNFGLPRQQLDLSPLADLPPHFQYPTPGNSVGADEGTIVRINNVLVRAIEQLQKGAVAIDPATNPTVFALLLTSSIIKGFDELCQASYSNPQNNPLFRATMELHIKYLEALRALPVRLCQHCSLENTQLAIERLQTRLARHDDFLEEFFEVF